MQLKPSRTSLEGESQGFLSAHYSGRGKGRIGAGGDVERTKSEASDGEAEEQEVIRFNAKGVKRSVRSRQAKGFPILTFSLVPLFLFQ